jgi:hypothetical protein
MRIGMMADLYKAHVSGVTHYVEVNQGYLERPGHDVFVLAFGSQPCEDRKTRVTLPSGSPPLDTEGSLA